MFNIRMQLRSLYIVYKPLGFSKYFYNLVVFCYNVETKSHLGPYTVIPH